MCSLAIILPNNIFTYKFLSMRKIDFDEQHRCQVFSFLEKSGKKYPCLEFFCGQFLVSMGISYNKVAFKSDENQTECGASRPDPLYWRNSQETKSRARHALWFVGNVSQTQL